jgi:hypothetical protein
MQQLLQSGEKSFFEIEKIFLFSIFSFYKRKDKEMSLISVNDEDVERERVRTLFEDILRTPISIRIIEEAVISIPQEHEVTFSSADREEESVTGMISSRELLILNLIIVGKKQILKDALDLQVMRHVPIKLPTSPLAYKLVSYVQRGIISEEFYCGCFAWLILDAAEENFGVFAIKPKRFYNLRTLEIRNSSGQEIFLDEKLTVQGIFSLPHLEKLQIEMCNLGYKLIIEPNPTLKELGLYMCEFDTRKFSRLTSIEKLRLEECRFLNDNNPEILLEFLRNFENLRELDLLSNHSPFFNLEPLQELSVEKLYINGSMSSDGWSEIHGLNNITSLRKLILVQIRIQDDFFDNMNSLESLYLTMCPFGQEVLPKLQGLKKLSLYNIPELNSLNFLRFMTSLEKLIISNIEDFIVELTPITYLVNLTELNIFLRNSNVAMITSYEPIGTLVNLKKLMLEFPENFQDSLTWINSLSNLKTLYLRFHDAYDFGLNKNVLKNLDKLDIKF